MANARFGTSCHLEVEKEERGREEDEEEEDEGEEEEEDEEEEEEEKEEEGDKEELVQGLCIWGGLAYELKRGIGDLGVGNDVRPSKGGTAHLPHSGGRELVYRCRRIL